MSSSRSSAAAYSIPASLWWVILLQGIPAIIIGILFFTDPGLTLVTATTFLGAFWFIGGIFDLVRTFIDRERWFWHLVSGVLGIIAGLIVLRHPLWASIIVPGVAVWLLGLIGIVIGVIGLFRAFFRGGGWPSAIMGVLSLLLGLVLLGNVLISTTILLYTLAALAIFGGVIAIIGAFMLKGRPEGVTV